MSVPESRATPAERIVDLYERHADEWARARDHEGTLYERGWLDRFCALIPSGGTILDLGCGTGEPIARNLGERGYAVMGIDSSPSMVKLFQARLPGQPAQVADMRTLALAQWFHGVLAWDSFFHLDHQDQRQMFTTFRAHVAPHGALMFTSGTTHSEAIGLLEGESLYHASLDAAEYRQLLADTGFTVVAVAFEDPDCGGRTVWLAQRG